MHSLHFRQVIGQHHHKNDSTSHTTYITPENPLKNSKKLRNKNQKQFQHWIYISKFGMFGNNPKNWSVILKNRNKNWKILTNCWKFSDFYTFKCSKRKFGIFRVLGEFWRGLEEPRSYKIYSSGKRGVKKGPGSRGLRDQEFLVPSLEFCY